MFRLLLASVLLCSVLVTSETYNGYQIISVEANANETRLLSHLDLDFLTPLRKNGGRMDILVQPNQKGILHEILESNNMKHSITVRDVGSFLDGQRSRVKSAATKASDIINFDSFHRHTTINNYLQSLASRYPNIVSVETIGQSYEGRNLDVIKISSGGNIQKPVIFIDAGIHAREWIAPATALYIINQLVDNSANRDLIQNVDWYILPVLNPDGYEYTHTTSRFWRKTRSPGSFCVGADANRNFDYYWGLNGASSNECSETFKGPSAFSEVELQAFRKFAQANAQRIKLYLTLHSYGNYLLYPWGYTEELPADATELQELGEAVRNAIIEYNGNSFTVGSSTNVLYAAAGGSDDWMKGVNGVNLSYTIELQGNSFDISESDILSSVQETFVGIRVFHSYVENKYVTK